MNASPLYQSLNQTDDQIGQELDVPTNVSEMKFPVPPKPRSSWLHKLSAIDCLILSLTLCVLPAAFGFLCFLWYNQGHLPEHGIWYYIVLHNWMTSVVALTAVVIRTCVSLQALVTTSMLASLVLERHGVPLHAVAQISAIRFINNGPFALLSALSSSIAHAWSPTVCAVLLFSTATLLQFTSTVLLADIGLGTVAVPGARNATFCAMSNSNRNLTSEALAGAQIGYWMNNQHEFPAFAEYKEDIAMEGTSNEVRDTGPTMRAFLPLGLPSLRTSIKEYSGIATVLDSRVVCVRPQVHEDIAVAFVTGRGWLLNGTLVPEFSPEGIIRSELPATTAEMEVDGTIIFDVSAPSQATWDQRDFTWPQRIPYAHDAGEWNVLQKLMLDGPALVSTLDPRYPNVISSEQARFTSAEHLPAAEGALYFIDDDPIPLMTGHSYVVLNMSVSENMPSLFNDTVEGNDRPDSYIFTVNQELNELVITPRDEWLVFTLPRVPGWKAAVSLCFDALVSVDAEVLVTANSTTTEPSLAAWDIAEDRFGTEEVRKQLGVLPPEDDETPRRSIMTLETTPDHLRAQIQPWLNRTQVPAASTITFPTQNFLDLSFRDRFLWGTIMCKACGFQPVDPGEGQHIGYGFSGMQQMISRDTLVSNAGSALAWQAYYTNLARMAYYDRLSHFHVPCQPTISWFRDATFPQTNRGLIAVAVLLSIHLVLILMITITFLSRSRLSRVGGNSWQTFAQVTALINEHIVFDVGVMDDRAVNTKLASAGIVNDFVVLKQWGLEGREVVGLRKEPTKRR